MEDRMEGTGWYSYAHHVAKQLAKQYGYHINQTAGVISALSPRNKWSRNIKDAKALISAHAKGEPTDTISVCTFTSNKDKALAILNGAEPCDVLTGQKTWNFYNNIRDPFDTEFVTIDFHAINIADGHTERKSVSKGTYREIAQAYIETAEELDLAPSILQAITWVTWRKNKEELLTKLTPC